MIPVETYLLVNYSDIVNLLKANSFIAMQGNNLLFTVDTYTPKETLSFLEHVFNNVNVLAVEKKNSMYYIISRKFESDGTEPFKNYKDISGDFNNSLEELTSFICSKE